MGAWAAREGATRTAGRLLAIVVMVGACGGGGDAAVPASEPMATSSTAPTATPEASDGLPAAPVLEVGGIRVGPLTPLDPAYISAEQRAAIEALAASASGSTPHDHTAHSDPGKRAVLPMWEPDQWAFDAQWSAAVAAVAGLDLVAEASAAGYTRAAVQGAGVGVHWVNWTLIDQPFDPTRPAMLLFDERRDPGRLVGFSFWLRSEGQPEGFVGPNDGWHQHSGICVVNGWVDREVSRPDSCAGSYLGGNDLWMLHAWVVPGWENRWGPFAVMNPSLCPTATQASDAARCPAESTTGL